MKVGIDLSSTNTGLVILDDNNKFIDKKVFNLWKDNKIDFDEICKLSNLIFNFWHIKTNVNVMEQEYESVYIGIELADFKNANYTNRFNRICGALEFNLWELPIGCNCKLFNSNEWQRFLLEKYKPCIFVSKKIVGYKEYDDGDGYIDEVPIYKTEYMYRDINKKGVQLLTFEYNERVLRKTLSRLFTKQNCLEYNENWTEDECDAYCIAYFLEKLRDRTQMHQEVKEKKIKAKKSKVQELRAKASKEHKISKLKDIVIKYKSMEKLTKAQQRALDKAEIELKEYEVM